MKQISSGTTFWMKRVFPAVWFGFLVLFMATGLVPAVREGAYVFLIGPVFMMVFGFLLFRKLVWDLADRVDDAGDALLVRRNGKELRIALRDVMNVSLNQFSNPRRITLRLRQAGPWGDEVAFIPQGRSFNPFARNPTAEDLLRRVDEARRT